MTKAAALLVASLGFFSLVAQALLFRSTLGVLAGSELAVGAFFASWLTWVALGALLARLEVFRRGASLRRLAVAALGYVPAFLLERWALLHLHELLGVPAWEVLPFDRLVLASFVGTIPVSLWTGALFVEACQALRSIAVGAVARVWVLEALGGAAGGAAATVLLAAGALEPSVFLLATTLLAGAVAASLAKPGGRRRAAWLLPLVPLSALALGFDRRWQAVEDLAAWRRLLPTAPLETAFSTPQARYLVGRREGERVVVSWGEVVETFPDLERSGQTAAVLMAEAPHARRVLVMGPGGLGVAAALARLPGLERVVWTHPDPDVPPALLDALDLEERVQVGRVETSSEDFRTLLARSPGAFDLVVLHLPEVTTLVLDRYVTFEALDLVQRALAADGVVARSVPGGENVVGPALADLGASAWRTLDRVFARTILLPGDSAWLLASDGEGLTTDGGELEVRWAAIPGADAVFPPEVVASTVPADRVAWQTARYEEAWRRRGDALLLDTDAQPKGPLFAWGLALQRAGRADSAEDVATLLRIGPALVATPLLLFAAMRLLFLLGGPRHGPRAGRSTGSFDAIVMTFTAGAFGMALGLVWMYLHQARFGSLYLEVGALAALTMLGLFVGGHLVEGLLRRTPSEPRSLVPALVGAAGLPLLAAAWLPSETSRLLVALGVFASGAVAGGFVPVAARRLASAGRRAAPSGSVVEAADHLGGATGAALTGLLLLPVLGVSHTLLALGGLIALNLVGRLVPSRLAARALVLRPGERRLRAWGFALAGLTAFLLVAGLLAGRVRAEDEAARFEAVARGLVPGARVELRESVLADGRSTRYLLVRGEGETTTGWVFDTLSLAPEVAGWGGRFQLAAHVDRGGRLVAWRLVSSRETPAYLALLDGWAAGLAARDLFVPDPFAGVDAVSGATVTSTAIMEALTRGGRRFARDVLGRQVERAEARRAGVERDAWLLLGFVAGALLLRRWPGPWLRRAYLGAVLVGLGLLSNLQYSALQVGALLQGEIPPATLTASFLLMAGVPVLVLLFGNVYCGYLCPFGAAQELLGDVRRRAWALDPRPDVSRYGRTVKYALLALILALFVLTARREVLAADPLVTVFGAGATDGVLALAAAVLLLSLPFGRFFCRSLCPAGAFLSLLNRVKLLRRWLPAARPGRCDLGIRHRWELDCICCDRCRHEPQAR